MSHAPPDGFQDRASRDTPAHRQALRATASGLTRIGVDRAAQLAWRVLHAGSREAFLESPPPPLRRLNWRADDGADGACFHMPAMSGPHRRALGEPVLLAHGIGSGWRGFALGNASLAVILSRAGHDVYLLAHRGDVDAPATDTFDVDDVAVRDLPAAIDAIRADTGWERVLAVGHGLGAHALLLHRALRGDESLAGIVLMGAAGRFQMPRTSHRAAAAALSHLPRGWRLPARHALRWALPFVASGEALGAPAATGSVARAWVRHAECGLAGGVLAQVARWHALGHLTDATGRLDVLEAVRTHQARDPLPALVIAAEDDTVARPADMEVVAHALGVELLRVAGGHLDPLCGSPSQQGAHAAVVAFLERARERCAGPLVRAG